MRVGRDMLGGNFKPNGDTTKYDWNGFMFDVQKRHLAIIDTDTTQVLLWAIGLDPEAHFVTDKGQKRSLGDSLRVENYKYYSMLAAAGSLLYIIKHCNKPQGCVLKQYLGTDEEVYELIKRHPALSESCKFCHGLQPDKGRPLVPPAIQAIMHYIGAHLLGKEDEASFFANTLAKFGLDIAYPHAINEGPGLHNPANLWLNWLKEQKEGNIDISRERKITGTIHAWNLYIRGRRIKQKEFIVPKFAAISKLDLEKI